MKEFRNLRTRSHKPPKTPFEIVFKSFPEYWYKECNGQKNNTVRQFSSDDERKDILDRWISGEKICIIVGIKNTKTNDVFFRVVYDVTKVVVLPDCEFYIISWKDPRVKD